MLLLKRVVFLNWDKSLFLLAFFVRFTSIYAVNWVWNQLRGVNVSYEPWHPQKVIKQLWLRVDSLWSLVRHLTACRFIFIVCLLRIKFSLPVDIFCLLCDIVVVKSIYGWSLRFRILWPIGRVQICSYRCLNWVWSCLSLFITGVLKSICNGRVHGSGLSFISYCSCPVLLGFVELLRRSFRIKNRW